VNLESAKVQAKTTTMAAVTLGSTQTDVKLDLASVQTSASTNTVGATFKVTNTGSAVINLSDVKVRYYFTKDTDTAQEFHCYNADISNPYRGLTSNVTGKFVKMDTAMEGADTYLEISFSSSAGTLVAGETVNIQSAFNKKDWTSYNQGNDYSFNDTDKIVILINNKVVNGAEPTTISGGTTPGGTTPGGTTTSGDASVKVAVSNGSSSNSVAPTFTVTNTSSVALDLTTLKLNYYYTADGSEAQTFQCYYAGTTNGDYKALTSNVVGKINALSTTNSTADTNLQVSFSGGSLAAGQSMTVQANVNKDGWANYDQTNDYSYNVADNVTAYINDVNVWGTAPGGESKFVSAKIDPTTATVDLAKLSDLTINMTLNDAIFTGITGLTQGTDYTVNGTVVTISKDYLAKLSKGTKELKFDMNKGTDPTLTINASDSTIDSTITSTTGNYDKGNKAEINIGMALNGNTLVAIKDSNNKVLIEGTDYTVNGTAVILTKTYLDTLAVGSTGLTFDFSKGNDPQFTITVVGIFEGLTINLPDVTGNAGDTIKIPVSLNGLNSNGLLGCNFKLKYDTTLFESPVITAGDACINPKKTMVNLIDPSTGMLSMSYADSTGTGSEAIVGDGVFANITLKIKDTAKANTSSKLEVTKAGSFYDKTATKYKLNYKLGTIKIDKGSTTDPTILNSVIDTTSANFDTTTPAAVVVGVTLNGNKLSAIKNGDTVLTAGTDYTVDGTKVTISRNYLSTLSVGSTSLTFDFSAGNDPTLTVNVKKPDIVIKDSVIDTTNANFDSATPADVVIGVKLNGNKLSDIKNGNAVLVAGKDYTTDGTKIIISKDYLSTLPVGSTTSLTFDFSAGNDPTLTVNVIAPIFKGMSVSIDQINAKAGDTVPLSVKLTGELPVGIGSFSYRIKYDPSILEVAGVEAGSAITNPDLNFTSSILADKGIVYVQFVDYNVTDADLIKTAGELTKIKFKVKSTAAKGSVAIGFNNTSDAFTDINSNELNVKFAGGSINIQ
jgi:hypothetical protein